MPVQNYPHRRKLRIMKKRGTFSIAKKNPNPNPCVLDHCFGSLQKLCARGQYDL